MTVHFLPRPTQAMLDIEPPPDTGDRRPVCHLCNKRPADVTSGRDAWCGACALGLFGGFYYDSWLGE